VKIGERERERQRERKKEETKFTRRLDEEKIKKEKFEKG
jgi:hypothetical protein